MDESIEEVKTFEDEEMRRHERLRNKIRSIAGKPEIAKLMAGFGIAKHHEFHSP